MFTCYTYNFTIYFWQDLICILYIWYLCFLFYIIDIIFYTLFTAPTCTISYHCGHQDSDDGRTYFLKIHAPWEVLATYAEVLKIKVPFKVSDVPHTQDVPFEWLSRPFRLPELIMRPQPDYFTSAFDKGKTDFFLIKDKDTFFPPSTRNRIVSSLPGTKLVLQKQKLVRWFLWVYL